MERILAILAGGKGERLRPLTETRPKPLLSILGEPMLCRHLRLALSRGSYDRVIVLASYMKDLIASTINSCGSNVDIVDQGGELGTGHAIFKVMEYGGPGIYTVIYSDIYIPSSVYEDLDSLKSPAVMATVTDRPWDYGVLIVEDGRLKGVVEKPGEKAPGNLIFAGILKLDYDHIRYFSDLKPSPRGELEATDAISSLASDHETSVTVIPKGRWADIGRPWDLLMVNKLALIERRSSIKGDIHPTSVLENKVIIEEGANVKAYTVIEGPAYIGRGAIVGPHAHIRPYTVLLEGSRVGAFTQVKASIIMEGARAPHLNYVGDSIIGEHANLGAGTITANYRFDQAPVKVTIKGVRVDSGLTKLGAIIGGYVRTGINVSILPGVKIGSRAWIWPGCVVDRDVEPGERYNCWAP